MYGQATKDAYYETTSRKENISCTFINLIENIQEYNAEKNINSIGRII